MKIKNYFFLIASIFTLNFSAHANETNQLVCEVKYIAYLKDTAVKKELEGITTTIPFDYYSVGQYESPDYGATFQSDANKAHFSVNASKRYTWNYDETKHFIESFQINISTQFDSGAVANSNFIGEKDNPIEQTINYKEGIPLIDGYVIEKAVLSCKITE
jgi:hypothetical protein